MVCFTHVLKVVYFTHVLKVVYFIKSPFVCCISCVRYTSVHVIIRHCLKSACYKLYNAHSLIHFQLRSFRFDNYYKNNRFILGKHQWLYQISTELGGRKKTKTGSFRVMHLCMKTTKTSSFRVMHLCMKTTKTGSFRVMHLCMKTTKTGSSRAMHLCMKTTKTG